MYKVTIEYFCLDYKFLVQNFISRNLKARYRRSILGMLWTLLIPAGMGLIYYIIFHFVLKVQIENYLLIIITGIVPWTFVANAVGGGTEILVSNYSLLNKVPLAPHSLILADNLTQFINLILGFPVILLMKYFSGSHFSIHIIQTIPLLILLFLVVYALTTLLSIMYIYFRDLKYLVGLIIQFWFYATPVMYSLDMIPKKFQFLLFLNPIGSIFVGFQKSVVTNSWMTEADIYSSLSWPLALTALAYFALLKTRYKIVEIL